MNPTDTEAQWGPASKPEAKGESQGSAASQAEGVDQQRLDQVSRQATDAITQTNSTVLGLGPAFAIVQSFLAQSQAQGVLFANMVQEHQQLGTAGLAATTQSVIQILNPNK